ncbi:MAG: dTDP-4-dehydrorhamnose 3,5-epimerase [Bacteroidales bacterium]|jgi:dTDP-4-dehydrorhamnose 3,5-epimerase|nr:dTDP-4-dehydrorhamnose 3,5-epimerase [Bacteroidales bacterium]NLK79940.1 dTDP-4-dehydrorhamnose 3,5-epimerase [Bacteroidales bacterium]
MKIEESNIKGIWIITPRVFEDNRGYFMESYLKDVVAEKTGPIDFIQENESMSHYGVTRGLHFQKEPYAQSKFIRVVVGEIFDVAVDIREGSPTYGRFFAIHLSDTNKKQLFIPKGFAHGFCVLSPKAIVQYKTDILYNPASEGVFRYNSPSLGIPWPLSSQEMVLSEKDKKAPFFT